MRSAGLSRPHESGLPVELAQGGPPTDRVSGHVALVGFASEIDDVLTDRSTD